MIHCWRQVVWRSMWSTTADRGVDIKVTHCWRQGGGGDVKVIHCCWQEWWDQSQKAAKPDLQGDPVDWKERTEEHTCTCVRGEVDGMEGIHLVKKTPNKTLTVNFQQRVGLAVGMDGIHCIFQSSLPTSVIDIRARRDTTLQRNVPIKESSDCQ